MKTPILKITFLLMLASLLLACSKNQKTVPVRILLTDNPAAYEAVNVHIQGVQVKINSEDAGWITVQSKDTMVNLLDLQNGVTMLLAEDNVPEGVLKEVRFILGSGNHVIVDGNTFDLKTPSSQSSGLKIKIDKTLQETLNTFVLDFDAALSVKEENGDYMLYPVIKLKP